MMTARSIQFGLSLTRDRLELINLKKAVGTFYGSLLPHIQHFACGIPFTLWVNVRDFIPQTP